MYIILSYIKYWGWTENHSKHFIWVGGSQAGAELCQAQGWFYQDWGSLATLEREGCKDLCMGLVGESKGWFLVCVWSIP